MEFIYTFRTPEGKLMLFGPYAHEMDAAAAFRRQFGQWPPRAVVIRPYEPVTEDA